jgi:hypothetical protein
MKKGWLAAVLVSVLCIAGCGKTEALTENTWQRVDYLPAETAVSFLTGLDLTPGEISMADADSLPIVRELTFTEDGSCRYGCSSEETRPLVHEYLNGLFTALAANPAALAGEYDDAFGVDMASMDADACKAFYAEIFGCEDYEALLDHLTDALFDYEALDAAGETRQFTRRGGKLFFTDSDGADLGCVDFTLTENGLTLDYGNTVEEYKKA